MPKVNCWEFMKCGEEEHCPAKTETKLNGIHGGINAGRACWAVAGTRCGGKVQGFFAQKEGNCMTCAFYKQVCVEEGISNMKNGLRLQAMLHGTGQ